MLFSRFQKSIPALVATAAALGLLASPLALLHPVLLILLFGWMGHTLNRIAFPDHVIQPSVLGRASLGFLTGFLAFATSLFGLAILKGGTLVLDRPVALTTLILVSLGTTLISGLLRTYAPVEPVKLPFKSYWWLLVFAAVVISIWLVNPIAQDNDSFLTITLSFFHGTPITLTTLRPIYTISQASTALLASLSPFTIYALLPALLFFAGLIFFWDYCKRDHRVIALVLAAPVIVTEILITRPQVYLLAFTLPLFVLVQRALEKHSLRTIIAGAAMSIILIPAHELSVFYLLMFLLAGTYMVALDLFVKKTISLKDVFKVALIIAPYFLLLPTHTIFGQVSSIFRVALTNSSGVHWDWWFLDSYKSIDGAQLGWAGKQAILYYLYNGLILYVIGLAAWIAQNRTKQARQFAQLFPVGVFLLIFLFFAEGAPRLGFTFLLNRAWPYVALAGVFLIAQKLPRLSQTRTIRLLASGGVIAAAVFGVAGSVAIARDNLALVFPEEQGVATYLSERTPANSLIISNQPNKSLVNIYGEREFELVPYENIVSEELLEKEITDFVTAQNQQAVITETVVQTYLNDLSGSRLLNTSRTVVTSNQPRDPAYKPDAVYYLFSKRKASGRNAARSSQYTSSGIGENTQVLLPGEVVFEDAHTILVKIK